MSYTNPSMKNKNLKLNSYFMKKISFSGCHMDIKTTFMLVFAIHFLSTVLYLRGLVCMGGALCPGCRQLLSVRGALCQELILY